MEYQVERDGESLTARLVEGTPRKIILTHHEPSGNETYLMIQKGFKVQERGKYAGGTEYLENKIITAYLRANEELGPELRAKIPLDWHEVLGLTWLPAIGISFKKK